MLFFTLTFVFAGYSVAANRISVVTEFDNTQFTFGYRLPNHVAINVTNLDFMSCVRSCVRRKECQSINFNRNLKVCEINRNITGQSVSLEEAINYLYSEFSSWNSNIDNGCHNRPCAYDQYCLPTAHVKQSGTKSNHICLNLEKSTNLPTGPGPTSESASGTQITSTQRTTVASVRLADGTASGNGRLELFDIHNSNWRSIFLDTNVWDWKVTQVFCRQMGFLHGGSYHRPNKPFTKGDQGSWLLDGIRCNGNEATIDDCQMSGLSHLTTNNNDVGLTCFEREVNWNTTEDKNIYLYQMDSTWFAVQITLNGENWANVCGGLVDKAATVFCKKVHGSEWSGKSFSNSISGSLRGLTKNIECIHNDTPHPFYCINEGWMEQACTDYAQLSCI